MEPIPKFGSSPIAALLKANLRPVTKSIGSVLKSADPGTAAVRIGSQGGQTAAEALKFGVA
jgi:hypothetical protein